MKKRASIILSAAFFLLVFLNPLQAMADTIFFPEVGVLEGVSGYDIRSSDFSHDDKYIVIAQDNNEISVWNTNNTSHMTSWDAETDGYLRKAIYNHDSTKIISADSQSVIKVWDIASGNLLNTFKSRKEGTGEVRDILVNEDSTILYVANDNKTVSFLDLNSGEIVEKISLSSTPSSLAYNPRDEELAILRNGVSLDIRDSNDGSYILSKEITGERNNMEYTSDYKTLFLTNYQRQPNLFDVENNYSLIPLKEEDFKMKYNSGWLSFQMTPNDKYVFATGYQIRDDTSIYDMKTKRVVGSIRGSDGSKLKINNNGDRLLIDNRLVDISQLPDRDTIGIKLNVDSKTMKTDESQEISVKELFNDGTDRDLELSSVKLTTSNSDVVNVLYGKLNSYKEGTAIITAEYEGFKYDLEVDVVMQTGWTKVGNTWYYLSNSGTMQTGWAKVENTWYYLSGSGAMQTGWTKVGNTWYYMNSSGAMQTGWTKVGNTWYYMNSSGAMQTGWTKVGNTWYYMNSSGAMQTGWTKVGNTWYYMSDSGAMQTGWTKVGNTWYYMSDSGAMQTGWLKLGQNWYFLNNNGSMQLQNKTINGKWYRFDSSGRML